jgi:hypothetical protein
VHSGSRIPEVECKRVDLMQEEVPAALIKSGNRAVTAPPHLRTRFAEPARHL